MYYLYQLKSILTLKLVFICIYLFIILYLSSFVPPHLCRWLNLICAIHAQKAEVIKQQRERFHRLLFYFLSFRA